jgi:hypothetical protein
MRAALRKVDSSTLFAELEKGVRCAVDSSFRQVHPIS